MPYRICKSLEIESGHMLSKHPDTTPVLLHFQNSAGKRVTVKAGEAYQVKRSPELETALDRWLE